MNQLVKIMIFTNVILIPFTIFVGVSLFHVLVDPWSNYVYDNVNDEGKRQVIQLNSQYNSEIYYVPIIVTNLIVLACGMFVGYSYEKNPLWLENIKRHKNGVKQ